MVPKIHAKGSSFVGLGKYVLHDKDGAETAERVEWTQTRNLVTEDPELAVRLMAATAMDADRLKANAGVKNTGRKSDKSVLHVTLAWHPDEGDELIPDEMQRAAELAIRAMGAEDRQALIVAHNDEQQPHIHIVINRVSPEDGRMLSSSKEKLKLSRFAEKYEKDRGEVLCEQRVINNAARDRGEYVRGEKEVPRHLYELHSANDNRPVNVERHRRQREKDKALGRQQRATRDSQSAAWAKLQREHKARRAQILREQSIQTRRAKEAVREAYRAKHWKALFHEHQAEMRAFERDERSFLGRFKNRSRAIDLKKLVGSNDRRKAISDAFSALASSGARLEWLKKTQASREKSLLSKQRREEVRAARDVRDQTKARIRDERIAFERERASLAFRCAGESAKMRAQWKSRREQRAIELEPKQPCTMLSPDEVAGPSKNEQNKKSKESTLSDLISDFKRIHDQLDQERSEDNENER